MVIWAGLPVDIWWTHPQVYKSSFTVEVIGAPTRSYLILLNGLNAHWTIKFCGLMGSGALTLKRGTAKREADKLGF